MKPGRLLAVIVVLLAGAVGFWLSRRAAPIEGRWQALRVQVDGAATDALVDRLNARLDGGGLRNAEPLGFAIFEGVASAHTKLGGDPWDLAASLRALERLSAAEPALTFRIDLEPDGEAFELRGGRFGARDAAVRAFLDAQAKRTRPELEGVFQRVELSVRGAGPEVRRAIEQQLAGVRLAHLGRIEYRESADGLRVDARVDGDVRTLQHLVRVFMTAMMGHAGMPVADLKLTGRRTLGRLLLSLEDWIRLEQELQDGAGPLRLEPPDPVEPPPAGVVARHPAAAALLGGHDVVLDAFGAGVLRLRSDGTLERLGAVPLLRSSEGNLVLHADGTLEDVAASAPVSFPPPPQGAHRQPRAFVQGGVLATTTELKVAGRVKTRLVLLKPDGTTARTDALVNAAHLAIAPAGDRAWLTAERDGRPQLLGVALPSLTVTAEPVWVDGFRVAQLAATTGSLIVALDRGPAGAAQAEIWRLRHGRKERLAAALPLTIERAARTGPGDLVGFLGLRRHGRPDAPVFEGELVTVDAATGRVEQPTERLPRSHRGRLTFAERAGGRWLVQYGNVGVWRLDKRPWLAFAPARGHRILGAALSPSGVVAVVSESDDAVTLTLAGDDDQRVEVPLPEGATPRFIPAGVAVARE